ncbi:COX assembly mitochondrial protein homolog isoform X3 [Patagioenas fasciata]|uniref:COX assembly mitochondrial protein homolog isoform X3 n=1 Tax=Patagioenas fasciata TaxID=372321 RepID=UPI0032E88AC0
MEPPPGAAESSKLRHVEKDVLIPQIMRERAKELCSEKVQASAMLKLDSWKRFYHFAAVPGQVPQVGPSEGRECWQLQCRSCSLGHHALNQSRLHLLNAVKKLVFLWW